MSILTWYEVDADHITLKFDVNVMASSFINNNFVLYTSVYNMLAPVANAFKPIVIARDYYSISRTLILYMNTELSASTSYRLDIQNLKDISNTTLPSDFLTWTTETTVGTDDVVPPSRDIVDVEDYSIKAINDFLIIDTGDSITATSISVINYYPENDISYNISPATAEGRIKLTFNAELAANYISTDYFKVQRRLVDSSSSKWESLPIAVTSNIADVYIYLPSTDATPVYGEPDHDYWVAGYKYRVRIIAGIGAADATNSVDVPDSDEDLDGGAP